MPKCHYKDCNNTSKSKRCRNLRYHPFPKPLRNMAKSLLWIELCGNNNLNPSNITKNVYICEQHFATRESENPEPHQSYLTNPLLRLNSLDIQSFIEVGSGSQEDNVNLERALANVNVGSGDHSDHTPQTTELSIFYNMSVTQVSAIFYTWVQFVYLQTCVLRNAFMKGARATDIRHMPACFRLLNDKVTVVLDTTEVRMQMSKNFQQQGNTHSSYKHYNTIKFLVGVSSRGAVVYNSEGYEGSISDIELFKSSDISVFLEEDDVLMADRGFTIQDICDEHKYKLIIPPFLAGRTRLTAEEEILTKKIAKCRITVERSIRRIKSYQILAKPVQISMLPIMSNIFSIICFLVNFEKPVLT
ncbi:uncharacterized protein LOC116180525 [Photinus pyralis]|uniref:uncharacterized protein LOC116180525 n=1 Tax=Photinus pyralis TaxID=7054 RepID=UPI001266FB0E|nr:uncharacterized protein LOC116180525 [Photinus pyralis]